VFHTRLLYATIPMCRSIENSRVKQAFSCEIDMSEIPEFHTPFHSISHVVFTLLFYFLLVLFERIDLINIQFCRMCLNPLEKEHLELCIEE
jgi:hypothetical protein